MLSLRRGLSLGGLLLLIGVGSVFGGDYADPSGFSFTYPENWIPVTRPAMGDVHRALPQEVQNWLAKNNVDFNRVAVVLIRHGREEFLENLNVVVEKQQIPANDKTVKQLTDVLAKEYGSMGVKVDNYQARVQKVGSHDAVVMEYQMQLPDVAFPLRQKQVVFPGGGKTYIVTCTGRVDSFDQYQPIFEKVLASFQVPAPVAGGADWDPVVLAGMVVGFIGVLVAGLFGIKRLSSKT